MTADRLREVAQEMDEMHTRALDDKRELEHITYSNPLLFPESVREAAKVAVACYDALMAALEVAYNQGYAIAEELEAQEERDKGKTDTIPF